ncbi:MFS transporter [Haloechinothrix halophila]|uniref:MFS transporter n=1 Tax=Haloechinothrix halophila TaxID=1069073 RepID=UPI00042111B8|nr:MFS transporter [Haloechinothrix halophila]
MPTTSLSQPDAPSPLRDGRFLALLLASIGLFAGFSLLVSVVPLWVVRNGGGEFAAGASTGVFMATTVLAQLLMTGLVRRFGYRAMSIAGALLIGVPVPLLALSTTWQPVLAISGVRGLGFGIVTVCGSALIAELLPAGSLGRGSGLYGLAVGVPLLVCLPASTAIAEYAGFTPVFAAGFAFPLLAVAPMVVLPHGQRDEPAHDQQATAAAALVWRPWLPMLAGSIAFGAMVTFLPLVFSDIPVLGSAALLLMSATALSGRWLAGMWGDRAATPGRLLLAGLAAVAAGLLGFAAGSGIATTAAMIVAAGCVAVYGAGFGVVQNDSLVLMFARVSPAHASVAWNVAFDAGQGAGAVAVGAVVATTSYPVAFGALGVLALAMLPVSAAARHGK